MSIEKKIKTFTATDIEKYWTGKLGPLEMHAMEKAAMDDPFLADAMEGYKNRTNLAGDLDTLRNKLDKRLIAPVVPLKQKRFQWLRIAAAIIIIGGIGVLIQQLVLKNRNESHIAISTNKEPKADVAADSNSNPAAPGTMGNQENLTTIQPDSIATKTQQNSSKNWSTIVADNNNDPDTLNITAGLAAMESRKTEEGRKDSANGNMVVADAKADGAADKLKERSAKREINDSSKFRDNNAYNAAAVAAPQQRVADGALYYDTYKNAATVLNHKFSYRVVDAQNNPVPFANVVNSRDRVGTYTDVRGNFNLVSSDSILNVQIKSLGYLSNNYKLVPSTQFRSLTLNEDYYARRQILDSNRQLVSNVTRKDTAELEEPEVGWGYFNTYVANNIQIPENIRKKSRLSNVELSFDVDKSGNPINITVTKSSKCKECDDEAIRLLKEGPKWKKKGRRSRTTISIAVDQK